jgi:hypothetical protein
MFMLCPVCAGEYDAPESGLCPRCDLNLIPVTLDPVTAAEIESATEGHRVEFVELCRPRLFAVAMLIKDTLEQHGVMVLLQGGHFSSVLPQLAFGGEMRLMVASDQLADARVLYEAYFERNDGADFSPDE